jgi:hypothetical protein
MTNIAAADAYPEEFLDDSGEFTQAGAYRPGVRYDPDIKWAFDENKRSKLEDMILEETDRYLFEKELDSSINKVLKDI